MDIRGSIIDMEEAVRPLSDKDVARLAVCVCHLLTSGKDLVLSVDHVLKLAQPHGFLIPMKCHRDEFVQVYNDAMQILGLCTTGEAHRADQGSTGGELAAPAAGL